jgi:hypothetical protein
VKTAQRPCGNVRRRPRCMGDTPLFFSLGLFQINPTFLFVPRRGSDRRRVNRATTVERERARGREGERACERERSQTTQHTTNNTHVRSSSLGAKRHKRRGSDKDRRHAEVTPHPAGFIVGRGLSLSHNKGLTHQACNKRLKTVTPTVPATLKTVTPTVPATLKTVTPTVPQLRCNSAATPLQLLP